MGDVDWDQEKIDNWLIKGMLTREYILSSIDDILQCCLPTTYATDIEEVPVLETAFSFACVPSPSRCGDILTESGFISLLQSKAALPRCPEGIETGQIIYGMLSYLRMVPFPSLISRPKLDGLSLEELARALVWALPDSARYVIEEGNFSRMRTLYDHQRLLFQSLATCTVPLAAQDHVRAQNRSLAASYSLDVDEPDFCVVNHDDDGDEIYHDMLDVIYSTQHRPQPWFAPVHRDKFRTVAKQIRADEQIQELHTLAIPAQRFKTFLRMLLVLQYNTFTTRRGKDALNISQFDDAAQCIYNAFTLDQDLDQYPSENIDKNGGEQLITWPAFSHALRTSAPLLFEPFYRQLTLTFLERPCWFWGREAFDTPPCLPSDSMLTIPRASQFASLLDSSVCPEHLQRFACYAFPADFPTPAALISAMQAVPFEAIVLLAGHQTTAATTTTSTTIPRKEEPYIFGFFSPEPKADGTRIQNPKEVARYGGQQATLFQLTPMQDTFRGVLGRPGWSIVTDANDSESIIFGYAPSFGGDDDSDDDLGDDKGGISLILRHGLRHAEIQHWGGSADIVENVDDNDAECSVVYKANPYRGDWVLELDIEKIEIWSEVPKD